MNKVETGVVVASSGGRTPVQPGEQFSLTFILNLFFRRWRLIAFLSATCLALGIVFVIMSPPRYTAAATMIIDTKRPQFVSSEMISEGQVDQAAVESQIETIRSEKVASKVVERLNLARDAEFIGAQKGLLSKIAGMLGIEPEAASDEAATRAATAGVLQGLRVGRVGRSYAVEIAFTSLDPGKAGRIANEATEAYITDQLEAKFESTQRASGWLQQRIAELRDRASEAYRAVQDFKQQNNIIIDAATGKLSTERELDELTSSLARARADTSQAEARLERIQSILRAENPLASGLSDPAVTDVLNNQVIVRLRQQFLDNQKQEADYAARYGRNHQAAVNLRNEMTGIQRAILDEVRRIAETYKSEFEISRARETSIDSRLREVFKQSAETRQNQVILREMETSAATYRSIYESFLSRYTQVVQQQSFPATEARVITAAKGGIKTAPRVGFTLVFSLLAGLGLGLGAAFAAEHLDKVIRTPRQLEDATGVGCLGIMPFLSEGGGHDTSLGNAGEANRSRNLGPISLFGRSQPFSPMAEVLRTIKVAVDLNSVSGDSKVVGLISSMPGEGKTTLALNIATMIAETGRSTLLIDADLRNPSLSRSFGENIVPNVLDVIAETLSLEDAVQKIQGSQLDILLGPVQITPVHSSEILASRAMATLLEEARKSYDYVLLDLPPLIPVVDVRAAARMLDAYILVVEWGRTTSDEVERALSSSTVLRERLLGAVLNKVDLAAMRRFEGYVGQSYSQHAYGYPLPAR